MICRSGMNRHAVRRRMSAIAICLFSLPGCVPPVVSLAGVALDAINGGGSSSSSVPSGPFAGGASAVQNRAQGDPAVNEALAQAEQRTITDECTAKLPPAKPAAATACAVRPVCLPGSRAPIRLRVCPHGPEPAEPERVSSFRPPGWNWEISKVSGKMP